MTEWLLICARCVAGREVKTIGILRKPLHREHCGAPLADAPAHPWPASQRDKLRHQP